MCTILYRIVNRMESRILTSQYRFISVNCLTKFNIQQKMARSTCNLREEWMKAKSLSEMPGPSKLKLLSYYFPGGKLYDSNLIDFHKTLRDEYGDIFYIKGMMGKPDVVFTYNPSDIEKVYRTEGIWPVRIGLDTFAYYRKTIRPDVFKNIGGLVSEQGASWANIRNKVNPIMMKVQAVRQSLPESDQISKDFTQKLEKMRDPLTGRLMGNFQEEVKLWAFESICSIGLNKRMGLVSPSGSIDSDALKLAKCMSIFFQLSYEFDIQPSIWKVYKTTKFKALIKTYDEITSITTKYINEAISKFETHENDGPKSILEKLCRINKQIAIVMAIDMLMAGMDTTSSVFLTILYMIAKNPEKQNIIRNEIASLLPHEQSGLTAENTKNMPYLRACIKEGLRLIPITPANFRLAGNDIVLSNYRVPKNTGVSMGNMHLSNNENYFPRSSEFLPERWLKSGKHACPNAKATNPFVYLPFGFGPRTCIGKRIAEMEIETLLVRLLNKYEISWHGSDIKYNSNIILVPTGDMRFTFKPLTS